ncbi:MAG: DUF1499 domain-containing protein [Geobacteraceae bacterium]|nr:DUF1499 domain-containing protein [Geobacteraceae bacterium]
MESSTKYRTTVLILPWVAIGSASAAALLLALAGLGSRFGWWHFRTGFDLLKYGFYGGICSALLALLALSVAGRQRHTVGIMISLLALASAVAIAAVPVSWRLKAKKLPMIHDITTDTVTPPQFVALLPLRKDASNPPEYGGTLVADLQKHEYSDLRTEVLDLPSSQAFERALAVARAMGWRIVAVDPAKGRIEASDTTFWFGFVDDIVIRMSPAGERTLVDIRSLSRVGKSDVGTNAKRIRKYLQRLRG